VSHNNLPIYEARVMDVISGDDLVLMVDLGVEDLFKRIRARLHGVDTPDAYRADSDTEAGAVRNDVRKITRGKKCRIEVHAQGRGGWVVTLYILDDSDSVCLNQLLMEKGFVYQGRQERS
jgi:hypothetical protein